MKILSAKLIVLVLMYSHIGLANEYNCDESIRRSGVFFEVTAKEKDCDYLFQIREGLKKCLIGKEGAVMVFLMINDSIKSAKCDSAVEE